MNCFQFCNLAVAKTVVDSEGAFDALVHVDFHVVQPSVPFWRDNQIGHKVLDVADAS